MAFRASALREWRLLRQRPWDRALISWVPLLACALLWWIFSAGLPRALPIGLLDQDHSSLSRQLTRFLEATPGLALTERYSNGMEAEHALRTAGVYAVVVIGSGFSEAVKHNQPAQVTLLHNAQFGTHSGLIQRDVRTAVGTLSAGVEMAARTKRGEARQNVRVAMEPVRADLVTLFNTALNYEQFLAAALIPAMLHILAMTAGAWSVGRELRDASLGEWLGPRPGPGHTAAALAGKLLWPWCLLGTVATVMLLWLTWGRGWNPQGSLGWTLLALWVFLALSICMGAFASSMTRSLRTALSATGFLTAPAFAFSGVGFPVVSMPPAAQLWAKALPYTHYIRVQIEQLQMGAPLQYSLLTPLVMAVVCLLLGATSAWALRAAATQPHTWGKR